MPDQRWIRAVVTLNAVSGIPEDAVQNTFHFYEPVAGVSDPADLLTPLANFYNVNPGAPAAAAVCSYLSAVLSRTAAANTIDLYEVPLDEGPVGAPISQTTWTLGAAGAGDVALPNEVAGVLTLDAMVRPLSSEPESIPGGAPGPEGDIHPRARRRGRLFLGPLNSLVSTAEADTTITPRVGGNFRYAATESAEDNLSDPINADGWIWAVFSRAAWDMSPIAQVWMDDAFDVQRRRGVAPSARIINAF